MEIYQDKHSPGKRVRVLLTALLSGVIGAILMVLVGLHYYGPGGGYIVEKILLSPQMITTKSLAGSSRYVFDKIEFVYFGKEEGWKRVEVDPLHYARLYDLIKKEQSLAVADSQFQNLFRQANPATLVLSFKTEGRQSGDGASKTFQEVQFLPNGDYFRIQLREESPTIHWAYYFYPGIYQIAFDQLK